jgi:hypothetical protein
MLADEARLAAQLSHRNIAAVLDLGEEEGRRYIAMEYVPGASLAHLLATKCGPLPPGVSLLIAAEVAAALNHAHHAVDAEGAPLGIVHRDVSPANILLSDRGEVKLADFGIAQATSRARLTRPGVLSGKLAYMAPEQANLGEVGPAADQFGLGLVLHEMLTGRPAYAGASDLETWSRAKTGQRADAREIETRCPEVVPVLRRMLALDPGQRFPDVGAVRGALLDIIAGIAPGGGHDALHRDLAHLVTASIGQPPPPIPAGTPRVRPGPVLDTPTRPLLGEAMGSNPRSPGRRGSWLVAGALFIGLAVALSAPTQRSSAVSPVEAAETAIILSVWTDAESDPALGYLTTLGPGLVGEALEGAPGVKPVFWFRFHQENRPPPPEPPPGLHLAGRLSYAEGRATVALRLVGDRGHEHWSGQRVSDIDELPAAIAELAGDLAEAVGSARPPHRRRVLPLGGERLRWAGIRTQGDAEAAFQMFRVLAQRFPHELDGYLWAGTVAWWHGPRGLPWLDEMIALAEEASAPEPVGQALAIMRGFLADGHPAWLLQARRLANAWPDQSLVALVEAEALMQSGEISAGLSRYRRVLKDEPLFGGASMRLFERARTAGDDAEQRWLIDRERRLHPTEPAADQWEMQRLLSIGDGSGVVLGRRLLSGRSLDRDATADLALSIAIRGDGELAESLLATAGLSATGARPRALAGLALARRDLRPDRYDQWVRQALPGGLSELGTGAWPEGDLRFAARALLIDLLAGVEETPWADVVARLSGDRTMLQTQDRRLLAYVDAAEAFRRRDASSLERLSGGGWPDAAYFASGLARELGGDLASAVEAHGQALAVRMDGQYAAVVSLARARAGAALGRPDLVADACADILAPRVATPYAAIAGPDCLRWRQMAVATSRGP